MLPWWLIADHRTRELRVIQALTVHHAVDQCGGQANPVLCGPKKQFASPGEAFAAADRYRSRMGLWNRYSVREMVG